MEQFFGTISPALLVAGVTAATQKLKQWFGLDGKRVEMLALALSYIALVPYQIITVYLEAPPIGAAEIAWLVFQALFYPVLGWLMAVGSYHLVIKPRQ